MGGAMSAAATAAALAATAAASASASVAAAESPAEPRNNPSSLADVLSISVFMAVFFPVFVVLLAFACLHLFLPRDDRRPAAPGDDADGSASRSRRKGGLDAAAIAALPLVFYREVRRHRIVGGRGDDALECSVCLLEFDDGDALRLLPTCPHAFHPDCIALWLERHPTCPLCRASVLDEPPPDPARRELELQPVPPLPLQSPEASPVHSTVVLIGSGASAGGEEEEEGNGDEEESDWTTIQRLARNRRAAGRQALPRSNSTGHGGGGASDAAAMERFALRLPEHVRVEILMSHRLRHVTSAVASVRVREGSAAGAHDGGGTVGGSVRNAVARLMSLFAPGAGWKADGDDRSGRGDATTGASSFRRRENSSRGAVAEDKRSV